MTTHLSSGNKDKDRAARIHECSAPSVDANGELKAPSLCEWFSSQTTPTLLCVDANEPPLGKTRDNRAPGSRGDASSGASGAGASDGGDSGGDQAATTVWSLLHSGEHVRSVWDDYFEPDGSVKNVPVQWWTCNLCHSSWERHPLQDQQEVLASGSDLVDFGKHKGKTYRELLTHTKYTKWCVDTLTTGDPHRSLKRYAVWALDQPLAASSSRLHVVI